MKDYEIIKTCKAIAESDNETHYLVIDGNDSVCSSAHSDNANVLADMFAMAFEEDSLLLKAAVKGLAILEGVDWGDEVPSQE